VGSGPFSVKSVSRNSSGIPQKYTLSSFKNYALGKPYLDQLSIIFYPNERALIEGFKKGEVGSINSITPEEVGKLELKNRTLLTTPLSRIFGVFFNQNQSAIFAEKAVRKALDVSLDKERIVNEVLSGFGVALSGPISPGFLRENLTKTEAAAATTEEERIIEAQKILEANGWKKNASGIYEKTDSKKVTSTLSFSLSTPNAEELKAAAELIKETWQSLGAKVEVRVFEQGDLSQNVIRPRKYEALLFGEIIGRDLDLFAFWHSSQRNDPGLNIAIYTNAKVDSLLSEARTLSSREDRLLKYQQFEEEIIKDTPAIFLYSPTFIYIVPKELQGLALAQLTIPSERFIEVNAWYVETEKVWKLFMNKRIKTP
jgi:peptide/nickel transport system substrate-binding protein